MKIVFIGPQRSGSTFISHCTAKHFDIPHIDELEFDVYHLEWMFKIVENKESWVVHAPGLFADAFKILNKFPDVTFAIVKRDINEIIKSQTRIKWNGYYEKQKLFVLPDDVRPISTLKYAYWQRWKKYFPSWVEYDYRDFELHPMWVPDEERGDFSSKQWEIRE
jgi:hypothetical protein